MTLTNGLGGEEEVAGSQGGVGRAVGGTVGGHGEGDDDESLVSPPASVDPYAALDSAFGGYMADEPRPQNKDLLDMI